MKKISKIALSIIVLTAMAMMFCASAFAAGTQYLQQTGFETDIWDNTATKWWPATADWTIVTAIQWADYTTSDHNWVPDPSGTHAAKVVLAQNAPATGWSADIPQFDITLPAGLYKLSGKIFGTSNMKLSMLAFDGNTLASNQLTGETRRDANASEEYWSTGSFYFELAAETTICISARVSSTASAEWGFAYIDDVTLTSIDSIPTTGDSPMAIAAAVIAVLSLCGIAVVVKKSYVK